MIAGLSGSLLSHDALTRLLTEEPALASGRARARGAGLDAIRSWHADVRDRLGPTSGARRVYDVIAEPLVRMLGFTTVPLSGSGGSVDALLQTNGALSAALVTTAWGQPLASVWRHAVHVGLAHEIRWVLCSNGTGVRLVDVARPYARRFAEFDIGTAVEDDWAVGVMWAVFGSAALEEKGAATVLDTIVSRCEQHRVQVRRSLRTGVHDALISLIGAFRSASKHQPPAVLFNESLLVVYRILFLLFAEARSLVPMWHPVYRQGYTIEALRPHLDRSIVPPGIWEALQAIARLAHRGCRAGPLRVPPFNGRLFSPADAPLADTVVLDDEAVSRAVAALTVRRGEGGRERISYADLGVEQLGAVYEHLLDYDLDAGSRRAPAQLVATGRRKATGSFYTPRTLTEFLVRRAFAPLLLNASSQQILALRVLDPAMGSGAFLVAACRHLASAYEQALVNEGAISSTDITEDDRAGFRRLVAQRCLFGVDVNPMAVQLGRLSLWLASLAADKPLTFLDHHLRIGNSLIGGSIEAILRQPTPGGAPRRPRTLPLFATDALQSSLESAIGMRLSLLRTPDDTLQQVRGKERTLAALDRHGGPLERWRTAASIWCAAWLSPRGVSRGAYHALLDRVLKQDDVLPQHVADRLLSEALGAARANRVFHWPLEFPEVFYDEHGSPLPSAGFDVIIGNPPWEMLRDDDGRGRVEGVMAFARAEYGWQTRGHTNLYQLFVERALHLLRPGGRFAAVLPFGFATDSSCSLLRRNVFDRTTVDTFTSLDNRDGIFPVHRSLKFLLITLSRAGTTREVPAHFGVRHVESLDRVPDAGAVDGAVRLARGLIERLSGDGLAVPEIRGPTDLEIAAAVAFRVPACGSVDGWNVRFGRELNATDDKPHFSRSARGMPVLEGKHLRPFGVDVAACRHRISVRAAAQLLDPSKTFERARLGYREVSSSSNKTTLMAAIVPRGVVTTHTVFCVKERLADESQAFLCGIFNSYVANYLVRMHVGTHVTAAIVARLPVPKPAVGSPMLTRVAALSRALSRRFELRSFARLNALVAELYGLTASQFAHVVESFPLVPAAERAAAVAAYGGKKSMMP